MAKTAEDALSLSVRSVTELLIGNRAIQSGGLDRGMAHELLDRGHANAQLVLASSECAPPCVTAGINACCAVNGFEPRAQRDRAHMATSARAADQWRCILHIS